MVLRGLRKVLVSNLKDYIRNFNEDQISASLLSGKATLKNLDLEPSKIAELLIDILPLSLEFKSATCDELHIKIPWSRLISHSSNIVITTLTVECLLHIATDEEWNAHVYRTLETAHERLKTRHQAGPYNLSTFDILRQRVLDGLQVQIGRIDLKLYTAYEPHIPKCITADPYYVEVVIEDVDVSPADLDGKSTKHLKDSNVLEQNPHKVVSTYKKISVGSLALYGRLCGTDEKVSLFAPIPVNCLIHCEAPADASRICPFVSLSNVAWTFPEPLVVETCDCQLHAVFATFMDLLRLEQYRLDPKFGRVQPEPVLQDMSSVTRTFARGQKEEVTARTFWSDLWMPRQSSELPRKMSADSKDIDSALAKPAIEIDPDTASFASVQSTVRNYPESPSDVEPRRFSNVEESGKPSDSDAVKQPLTEMLRPILPSINLAAGNIGSLFAKKAATHPKIVSGFHPIDIESIDGTSALDLGFDSQLNEPVLPVASSAKVDLDSLISRQIKIEPGFHRVDIETLEVSHTPTLQSSQELQPLAHQSSGLLDDEKPPPLVSPDESVVSKGDTPSDKEPVSGADDQGDYVSLDDNVADAPRSMHIGDAEVAEDMDIGDADFFSVVSSHPNVDELNSSETSIWTRVQTFFGAGDASTFQGGEGPWEVQSSTMVRLDVVLVISLQLGGKMQATIDGLDLTLATNRHYHPEEFACMQRLRGLEITQEEWNEKYPYTSSAGTMLWRSFDLSMDDEKVIVAKGPVASRWEWKDRSCPPDVLSGLPIWPFHITFREMWIVLDPAILAKIGSVYGDLVPFFSSALPPPFLLPAVFEGSDVEELWPVDSTVIDLLDCILEEPAEVGKAQNRWPLALKTSKLRVSSVSDLLSLDSKAEAIQRIARHESAALNSEDVVVPKAMFSSLVASLDAAAQIQAQLVKPRKKSITLPPEQEDVQERMARLEISLKDQEATTKRLETEYGAYRENMKQKVDSLLRKAAQRESELQSIIHRLEMQPTDLTF